MPDDTARGPAESTLTRHTSRWPIGKAVAEVVLIALGVFLGLAGEQWRANAERRAQTVAALQRFRTEVIANQKAVAAVKDYHVTVRKQLQDHFSPDPARKASSVRVAGIEPVMFEHTAWDLAIATQSLSDIDQDLAYGLTRVYGSQDTYQELTRGILQAMYLRPVKENPEAFLASLDTYYGDIVLIEPALLRMYEELLPQIDRALR